MKASNYRITTKKKEILKLFKKLERSQDELTVWQNVDEKNRVVVSSDEWEVDKSNKSIVFTLKSKKDAKLLRSKTILYLHGSDCSLVFKCNKFVIYTNKVIISMPKKVRVLELRENPRFSFKNMKNKIIEHRKEIGLSGSNRYKNFIIDCYDISQTGISFELHRTQLLRYRVGDELTINEIAGLKSDKIGATVVYICPLEPDENGLQHFKAGLKFDRPLDNEMITKILLGAGSVKEGERKVQ